LAKASVDQSRHIRPEKQIDKPCGPRFLKNFLKKTRNQIIHRTRPIDVSPAGRPCRITNDVLIFFRMADAAGGRFVASSLSDLRKRGTTLPTAEFGFWAITETDIPRLPCRWA
jgi:hypothetical protein